MKLNFSLLMLLLVWSGGRAQQANFEKPAIKSTELNTLSVELLQAIRNGQDTKAIREKVADIPFEELTRSLITEDHKLAFWINIYNAYIQVILAEQPELYQDKKSFFKKEQILIAGRRISFEDIEHGIIRKSQWPLGQGRIRKWFPDKFERRLRVKERDFRIHFALNCGAMDCPPVFIYNPAQLQDQLEKGTRLFLNQQTDYHPEKKEVAVTAIFSWFRGDFGGKKGILRILEQYADIPDAENLEITYKDYDWTLDLNNWADF